MKSAELIRKYNVPSPRYTSYPTVPYWEPASLDMAGWEQAVSRCFEESNTREGISLYIHLPFCESLCTYCGCNKRITRNHGVELPYIQALLKEWELYLHLLGNTPLIREIHLGGGTPTFFSSQNLHLLIRGLLQGAEVHRRASFSFEAHPRGTTTAHLETLYELGFRRLSLGIQDFDPAVQQIINRLQSYEEVESITRKARQVGYSSINFDLIYGLPRQSLPGLEDTIAKVNSLMPDRIAFYSYAHVPWKQPGQRRYTEADLPSAEEKQQLHEFGRSVFMAMGYREIGMDHFALETDSLYQAMLNGQLHRNFMGYTHQHTDLLIGLGVSAISDARSALAQNVKELEQYHTCIREGRLPLLKGHLLNGEDQAIRQHILDLMCKGHTGFDSSSLQHRTIAEGLERMHFLAADGLVIIGDNRLEVTRYGKRFLRNICMALDARLWEQLPGTQLFSMSV